VIDKRFLAAVVDTLVPGGALANGLVAPAASTVGVAEGLASDASDHRQAGTLRNVLAAIAQAAGGEADFAASGEELRIAILKRVETLRPRDFLVLVTAVLIRYYEHPSVVTAFGWTARPPQPLGHAMPPFDPALLEPVIKRGNSRR
jgi:hypothetical protein